MTRWLKMLGSGMGAMDESLVPLVLERLQFPKRPTMRVGDKVVLYALGHDRVFAIVEVFMPPKRGHGPNPWDEWTCPRKVMVTTYALAPGLDDISWRAATCALRSRATRTSGYWTRSTSARWPSCERTGADEDSYYRP